MKKFILTLLIIVPVLGKAQNQFHLGQYMVHQPFINPAAMGSYERLNAAVFYKKQWAGFTGAPELQGFNINTNLKGEKNFLGLTVVHDVIGVNNATEISGSYAYKIKTGLRSSLVFGLSASLNLVQSDFNALNIYDQNDPNFSGNTQTFAMPNFKFGTYFFKKNFYAGLAVPNILENKIIFTDKQESVVEFDMKNIHYYLHSGYKWKLSEEADLNTSFLLKEANGSPLQVDFNVQAMFRDKVGIGASYRTSKELLAMVAFKFVPELMLSYGYELNFSDIGNYSSGTHEIMLVYRYNPPQVPVIAIPRF